jgi:hypothetical protein
MPETREREQLAVVHFETARLLVLPFFPFVECVYRNQATLRLEGFPKRRSCGDCFGSRVDRLVPMLMSLAQEGKSPHRMVASRRTALRDTRETALHEHE